MKKNIFLILCLSFVLALTGCSSSLFSGFTNGNGSLQQNGNKPNKNNNGTSISRPDVSDQGEEIDVDDAMVILNKTESDYQSMDSVGTLKTLALDKFSYSCNVTMGEASTSMGIYYSNQDRYLRTKSTGANIKQYDFDLETNTPTDTLIGELISNSSDDYFYIDSNGVLIDANNYSSKSITYIPERKETNDSYKRYRELADNLTDSEVLFAEEIEESGIEYLSSYLQYSRTLLTSLKPMLQMGSITMPGMTMDIRSKGGSHLYIKFKMNEPEMYYECVIEDGYIGYIKMVVPNVDSLPGMEQAGNYAQGNMTVELSFDFNSCKVNIPDLSKYTKEDN